MSTGGHGMVSAQYLLTRLQTMCYDFSNSRLIIFFSMEGGELFQRIQDRQDGAFTERGINFAFSYGICSFKTFRVFLSNIIQKLYVFLQKPRR
jgi:hypothetical protein